MEAEFAEDSGRSWPFLDVLVTSLQNGSFKTMVFRKPTQTNLYLSFRSNYPIEHKRGVVKILIHRAEMVVTSRKVKHCEEHIDTVATHNTNMENVSTTQESSTSTGIPRDHLRARRAPPVILPYIKGVSEQLRRLYNFYDVPPYLKPITPLDNC